MTNNCYPADQNCSTRFTGLTYRALIKFYIPLAISSIFIQLAHMTMNIALGALPEPDLYISAYSVAKGFSMLMQSPGMFLSVLVATFVINQKTFARAIKFTIASFIIMVSIQFVVAFTPVSRFIFSRFYNLDGLLLDKAVISLRFIIFFSMCVFIRCFFMGVALKMRQSGIVAASSGLRLLFVVIASATVPFLSKHINNDYIPGLILLTSGIVEAGFTVLGVTLFNKNTGLIQAICLASQNQGTYNEDKSITYKELLLFSMPMMLSFTLEQLVPSVTNAALALTENNVKTIAAYAIAVSVANVILSATYQYHNIIVCHDSLSGENRKKIIGFAVVISAICGFLMLMIGFTPVGDWILVDLMNALPDTAGLAKLVFKILPVAPAMMIFQVYKRGKLMKIRKTNMLIIEKGISSLLPYMLFLIIPFIPWQYGATAGVGVSVLCNLAAGMFTHIMYKHYIKKDPALKYI